jgi:TonB family protein
VNTPDPFAQPLEFDPGAELDRDADDPVFRLDAGAARARTRWSMGLSSVVHAILVIWLVVFPPSAPGRDPITEIAYLDPGDLPGESGGSASAPSGVASAPATTAPPATVMGDPTAAPSTVIRAAPDRRFERAARTGLVAPNPEAQTAFSDRLESRLATLKADATANPRLGSIEPPVATSNLWKTPATIPGAGGSGGNAPIELRRGGQGTGGSGSGSGSGSGGGSGTLGSGSGTGSGMGKGSGNSGGGSGSGLTALATASLPADRAVKAPADAGGDVTAKRTLAGASLAGPIADRRIVSYARPVYPDWAKREGVEGSVTLYFLVLPDGVIRENVMVQKTAGFEDFDTNAVEALRAWRFAPLPAGRTGDQWGTITFHYRLRDTP